MLTLCGTKRRSLCDKIARRDFLRVGALGIGGLTLADLLRAQQVARPPACPKAVIMIYLNGGPSHIDTYDLKPEAPSEYRGEFKPIQTNVSGIDICEHMPLQAKIADKLAIIRNMRFLNGDFHLPDEVLTGVPRYFAFHRDTRPAFGSVVSKLHPRTDTLLPPYVVLNWFKSGFGKLLTDTAYLSPSYRPFEALGSAATQGNNPEVAGLANLSLQADITLERLEGRKKLLKTFDALQRDMDTRREVAGMDSFYARALEMIVSPQVRDAFDLSKEPDKTRHKYGRHTTWLMARRLAEAGASVITLKFGPERSADEWDTHGGNFVRLRQLLPEFDQAVYALVTDLYERGLERDVAVVIWGDMGRTPKINNGAGRDHWTAAGFTVLAGGGFKMGQVIGATTPRAERPAGESYTPANVLATLYRRIFDIDPETTLPDRTGRPMQFLDERALVRELL